VKIDFAPPFQFHPDPDDLSWSVRLRPLTSAEAQAIGFRTSASGAAPADYVELRDEVVAEHVLDVRGVEGASGPITTGPELVQALRVSTRLDAVSSLDRIMSRLMAQASEEDDGGRDGSEPSLVSRP
jgi:hypothetical protein